MGTPTPAEISDAIGILVAAGATIEAPRSTVKMLTVKVVADSLAVSGQWVRDHLNDFPGRIDIGSGKFSEWRIPECDVIQFVKNRRIS